MRCLYYETLLFDRALQGLIVVGAEMIMVSRVKPGKTTELHATIFFLL